ncbi:hypothetical protein AB0O86_06960 [Streptomyces hirsutus]|uniref:hypothetical protein n=1 Tax=Streptomyces hirsutus TaxID=35620 RepID=UPI00343C8DDB
MIVKKLHASGIRAERAYTAGFLSIGMSVITWCASLSVEKKGEEHADRLGIFVGEWAPTFFALGLALSTCEK